MHDPDRERDKLPTIDLGWVPWCQEPVWDGPYRFACGRMLVNGKCSLHGGPPKRGSCNDWCGPGSHHMRPCEKAS